MGLIFDVFVCLTANSVAHYTRVSLFGFVFCELRLLRIYVGICCLLTLFV